MDGRALVRSCAYMLVAATATGCGPLTQFFRQDPPASPAPGYSYPSSWGKSATYPNDNTPMDGNAVPGSVYPSNGGVVPSAGSGAPPGNGGQAGGQPANPYPLQAPTPLPGGPMAQPGNQQGYQPQPTANAGQPGSYPPGTPGCPPGTPGCAAPGTQGYGPVPGSQNNGTPGTPGCPAPGTPGYGAGPGNPGMLPDPHTRSMPTAVGSRLELAPWEVPADRVVELSKQVEAMNSLNRMLLARIKELEANGATREQAIAEAVRDLEAADAAVVSTRASLHVSREEAAVLRARLQLMEKEDVEMLRAVIGALEKLLSSPTTGRSLP